MAHDDREPDSIEAGLGMTMAHSRPKRSSGFNDERFLIASSSLSQGSYSA